MISVGFFVRHFFERGTEVAIYDYAHYNETILNNKSCIICFTPETQNAVGFPVDRISYNRFKARFDIIEISSMNEMAGVIQSRNLSFFYTLTHGGGNDIYHFNDKNIWGTCKTIKHCVFDTKFPEADFYVSISEMLNAKNKTNVPVIPHIACLPDCNDNLRQELGIPTGATVYGRYGGYDEFNIDIMHAAIREYLSDGDANVVDNNCYFLFMNTAIFYEHPRIIYLDKSLDYIYKVKFINTCDAMIHARQMGETFGLSIAEFSIRNKPIITCMCGDTEHIKILGERAIIYNSIKDLLGTFKNIKTIIKSSDDWNAYTSYSPESIMVLFKNIFDI